MAMPVEIAVTIGALRTVHDPALQDRMGALSWLPKSNL
jgi:hypothetical protein